MKKLTAVFLALILAVLTPVVSMGAPVLRETETEEKTTQEDASGLSEKEEEVFAEWNDEAPALQTLIAYVEDVTDSKSKNFIPEADRIATFDMDGTLYAELFPTYLEYYMFAWRALADPSYEADKDVKKVAETIRDCALDKSFPDDMAVQHAQAAAKAYSGMTLTEFADYTTSLLLHDADGFEGMTYAEAFYLPMLEVIDYLQENDFTVYVVSGSDRQICRTLLEGMIDIPYANIIGMDVAVEASGQGSTDGLDYVFSSDDEIIRTDQLLIKNIKMNKVVQIVRDIGKQPVLSFGNTSGDVSMHNYTIDNNPYRSEAFMLIADDEERDYGNTEAAEELRKTWEENGYNVISMKDDFKTIYGENVKKTGSFHWLKELDGTKAAADTKDEQDSDDEKDVQYVLYLGTNDKDTNEPVYEKEECREKVKEILMKEVGGYTIQEAEGGWIGDDGKEYQEYTLVISLSDTTKDKVHKVADQLISEFNQSSVLIQENTTVTEFYEG